MAAARRAPWWPWATLLLGFVLTTGLFWCLPDRGLPLKFVRATWVQDPWTLWSAPFVHLSAAHALGNVGALVLLAALGWALRAPAWAALAALLAWPMSTAMLLAWPSVQWVAGLSGLVHALWAVLLACSLAASMAGQGDRPNQWVLAALSLGLLAKLAIEAAWAEPLVTRAAWSFKVATAAHLGGAVAGLAAGGLMAALVRLGGGKRL